jgi:hypothetical protein
MMAYGDIELASEGWDESWRRRLTDAIERASWPGSASAVPIRRNGLKIAYIVGAGHLEELERKAGVRT